MCHWALVARVFPRRRRVVPRPRGVAGGLGLALRRGGGGATSAERRERRERREGRGELQSSALAGGMGARVPLG